MLATGYVDVEPEKAFPILDDSILRLNDTINAFIKVGAFMDTTGEILDNGELLVLEPADALKARYDSETLEEAFFAASGHAFENGDGEED